MKINPHICRIREVTASINELHQTEEPMAASIWEILKWGSWTQESSISEQGAEGCTTSQKTAGCTASRETAGCTASRETAGCTSSRETAGCTGPPREAECTVSLAIAGGTCFPWRRWSRLSPRSLWSPGDNQAKMLMEETEKPRKIYPWVLKPLERRYDDAASYYAVTSWRLSKLINFQTVAYWGCLAPGGKT